TWRDEASDGAGLTQVIGWKIPDRVLEITTRERDNESVALVTVDASSGEVVHAGGNARGDLVQGKWDLSRPEDAVLTLQVTGGTGQKLNNLGMHHRWLEEGRLERVLDLPQPIRVKMKRSSTALEQ
ncbi:MAG: hypothetical protein ACK5TO_12250, partial [Planctomycetaceae bacterium]